jgi:hypothetical protein
MIMKRKLKKTILVTNMPKMKHFRYKSHKIGTGSLSWKLQNVEFSNNRKPKEWIGTLCSCLMLFPDTYLYLDLNFYPNFILNFYRHRKVIGWKGKVTRIVETILQRN